MIQLKTIKDELLYIKSQNNEGFLNPKEIVQFAKDPQTKLHSSFEWDDTKAAKEYRLYQARHIIRLVFSNVVSINGEEKEENLFFSLQDDRTENKGYRLIYDIMEDDELREKLLNEALNELIRIKNKYKKLTELAKIFNEIEKYKISIE